jgi:hypothetical protein
MLKTADAADSPAWSKEAFQCSMEVNSTHQHMSLEEDPESQRKPQPTPGLQLL